MKESDIHKGIVAGVEAMDPNLLFWHTPSGFNLSAGYSRFGQISNLKKMGWIPGTPDLFFYHGGILRAMEIKTEKGRLSIDQAAFGICLEAQGCDVAIARSVEEGMDIISDWGLFDRKLRGAA